MAEETRVVAICGSLREDSKTRVVLREALAAAQRHSADTELVDLREYHLPVYGRDDAGNDAGDAPELRRVVDGADGIVLGTPIYHGSYSSPLKTALDYCGSDEFAGKTVGLVAVAGGGFPSKGLEHLRNVSRHVNAWVLPREVGVPDSSSTVGEAGITDETIARRVRELGKEVVLYAGIEDLPELRDAASGPVSE